MVLGGPLGVNASLERGIIVDQEVSLYQVKALSRTGSFVDWKALAAKVPGARLTQWHKTHCVMVLPKENIAVLDELLEHEYPNVRRAPTEKERVVRSRARETRMWR